MGCDQRSPWVEAEVPMPKGGDEGSAVYLPAGTPVAWLESFATLRDKPVTELGTVGAVRYGDSEYRLYEQHSSFAASEEEARALRHLQPQQMAASMFRDLDTIAEWTEALDELGNLQSADNLETTRTQG